MLSQQTSTQPCIHADDYASPALMELLKLPVTQQVADYLGQQVSLAVEDGTEHPRSSLFPGRALSRAMPKSSTFVMEVLHRSRANMATVLTTLVYVDRVRPRLNIVCKEYAFERVFLGALIVARKFIHDCNYRCKHWAQFTKLFGPRDISRMEREFLEVLQFDLTFKENDLLAHHDSLMYPPAPLERKLSSASLHRRRSTKSQSGDRHPMYSKHPHHPHFASEKLNPAVMTATPIAVSQPFTLYTHRSTGSSSSSSGSSPESDEDELSPQTPAHPAISVAASVPFPAEAKRHSSLMNFFRPHQFRMPSS